MGQLQNTSLYNDASLVAYWKLEDVNATIGGFTLTNNNTVGFNAGLYNLAADGGASNTNKYLSVANNLGIAGNGTISVSLWLKLTTEIASGTYGIFVHGNSTTDNRYIQIYYEYNSGTRRIVLDNSGTNTNYNIALGTTNWYHLVLTRNSGAAGTADLWVNNVKQISAAAKSSSTTGNKFNILSDNSAVIFLSGLIDDVGVFNKVLSATEVAQIYQSGGGFAALL